VLELRVSTPALISEGEIILLMENVCEAE